MDTTPREGGFSRTDEWSLAAEAILRALFGAPHAYESADGFAVRAGLRNRHQLNRILRRAGLPPFRSLSTLVRIVALRDDASTAHRSLCAQTVASGHDPAWAYRAVKRLTGQGWSDVRALSHDDIIAIALEHCCRTADQCGPQK